MPRQSPSASPLSRRSVLGLLGAVPLAAGGVLTGAGTARAHTPPDPAKSGALPKDVLPGGAVDRFVKQETAAGRFSGTILVAYQGEPVLTGSYSMADKERSIPNRPDTRFPLASVTKSFTGMAIDQLTQEGKLKPSQKLGDFLDGFPAETAGAVTVEQLVAHTSGLGNFRKDTALREQTRTATSEAETMDRIMASIRKAPLEFTPGSKNQYSNSGYVVLGAIVAAVSGQSYYDYVREHVFAPAGMTCTDFLSRPQREGRDDIAHPYELQAGGRRVDYSDQLPFVGSPAGDAYSTVSDMVRFVRALRGGKLLNPTYTRQAISGKQAGAGVYGGAEGRSTCLSAYHDLYPEQDWAAVFLSNYDNNRTIVELSLRTRAAITGKPVDRSGPTRSG